MITLSTVDTRESSGARVAFNQFSFFVRGAGGFGGKRTSDKLVPAGGSVPDKPPSFTATQKTNVDQVWLCTDVNFINVSPIPIAIL